MPVEPGRRRSTRSRRRPERTAFSRDACAWSSATSAEVGTAASKGGGCSGGVHSSARACSACVVVAPRAAPRISCVGRRGTGRVPRHVVVDHRAAAGAAFWRGIEPPPPPPRVPARHIARSIRLGGLALAQRREARRLKIRPHRHAAAAAGRRARARARARTSQHHQRASPPPSARSTARQGTASLRACPRAAACPLVWRPRRLRKPCGRSLDTIRRWNWAAHCERARSETEGAGKIAPATSADEHAAAGASQSGSASPRLRHIGQFRRRSARAPAMDVQAHRAHPLARPGRPPRRR